MRLVPEYAVRLVEEGDTSGFMMGLEIRVVNKGRPVTIDKFGFTFDSAPPLALKKHDSDSSIVPADSLKEIQHDLPKKLMKHDHTVIFVNLTALLGGVTHKKADKKTLLQKSWPPATAWVKDVEGYYYECTLRKHLKAGEAGTVTFTYRR